MPPSTYIILTVLCASVAADSQIAPADAVVQEVVPALQVVHDGGCKDCQKQNAIIAVRQKKVQQEAKSIKGLEGAYPSWTATMNDAFHVPNNAQALAKVAMPPITMPMPPVVAEPPMPPIPPPVVKTPVKAFKAAPHSQAAVPAPVPVPAPAPAGGDGAPTWIMVVLALVLLAFLLGLGYCHFLAGGSEAAPAAAPADGPAKTVEATPVENTEADVENPPEQTEVVESTPPENPPEPAENPVEEVAEVSASDGGGEEAALASASDGGGEAAAAAVVTTAAVAETTSASETKQVIKKVVTRKRVSRATSRTTTASSSGAESSTAVEGAGAAEALEASG